MGLNSQSSVPTFTSGQVLTAQQQNWINTGVPVFDNTTQRDGAFGGASEKTLAEGQMCYLESTNMIQYYDGAAWRDSSSWGLVVPQTSFTTSSSIVANSIYTSQFEVYQIVFQVTSSAGTDISFRNRVGGVSAATNYNYQALDANGTSVTGSRVANNTSFVCGQANGAFESSFIIRLVSPNIAKATNIFTESSYSVGAFTVPIARWQYGNHSTATAYDGFEVLPSSGTLTGTYTVWGMSK